MDYTHTYIHVYCMYLFEWLCDVAIRSDLASIKFPCHNRHTHTSTPSFIHLEIKKQKSIHHFNFFYFLPLQAIKYFFVNAHSYVFPPSDMHLHICACECNRHIWNWVCYTSTVRKRFTSFYSIYGMCASVVVWFGCQLYIL